MDRTDIGARVANCISPERLRIMMIVLIGDMALFMTFKVWL